MACIVLLAGTHAMAQLTPDQVRQRIAASKAALETFLDPNLDEEARLESGRLVGYLGADDVEGLLTLARDEMAAEPLRSMALVLAGSKAQNEVVALCQQLLTTRSGGGNLRSTCVHYLSQQVEFSYRSDKSELIQVLRGVLSEQEVPEVRQAAISYLSQRGDDKAVEFLRQAITSPKGALLDQSDAIGYALATPELYVEQFAAAFESGSANVQSAAITGLASYPDYQARIVAALENSEAPFEVRQAAAESLAIYAPSAVSSILKVAGNEGENEALRAACIQQLSVARQKYGEQLETMSPVNAEMIQTELRRILEQKPAKGIQDAAGSYLNAQ